MRMRGIHSLICCSAELGYPEDAIETKVLNLAEGANFSPEFVKIVRISHIASHVYRPCPNPES